MDDYTIDLNLTEKNADPFTFVCACDNDSLSIQAEVLGMNSSFNSGIITIKKSNRLGGDLEDLDTVTTITADGITDIDVADWAESRFVVPVVTTKSTTFTKVRLTFIFKKFNFNV